jgi:hypothetical protein
LTSEKGRGEVSTTDVYLLQSDLIIEMSRLYWVLEGSDNRSEWQCIDKLRLARPPALNRRD